MPVLDSARVNAELRARTAAFAELVTRDPAIPVPTCPGWTYRHLATHLGRGHLWAAQMVADRATQALPLNEVEGGKLPDGPQRQRSWLSDAAEQVAAAVSAAGSDPVWTFLGVRPATFWARRRMHEAVVHLADAQLAAGVDTDIPADLAADGVDEWLDIVAGSPSADTDLARARGNGVRGDGQTLYFHATDAGPGAGQWLVRRTSEGAVVQPGHAAADVAVRGPAALLLLVLTRRVPADAGLDIAGDERLFAQWLANTPF